MSNNNNLKLTLRPSHERFHGDHGWLKTYHSWSFAEFYDPKYLQFGPLRVLNEDFIDAHQGFPTHAHKEFEIWSYIIDGELSHKDSMGNVESVHRGDIQYTTGGTGISHSEFNKSDKEVHLLQIWAKPSIPRLTPSYYTRHVTDAMKLNTLKPIIKPVADFDEGHVHKKQDGKDEPIPINADLTFYASILESEKKISHALKGTMAYVHVAMTSGYTAPSSRVSTNGYDGAKSNYKGGEILVNGSKLHEGDGLFIENGKPGDIVEFENTSNDSVEFVFFDMGK